MGTNTMISVLVPLTCEYKKYSYMLPADYPYLLPADIHFLSILSFIRGYPRVQVFLTSLSFTLTL